MSFFKLRTAEEIEQQTAAFHSSDPRTAGEIARDTEIAALLRNEERDDTAARLLAVARVIGPSEWETRENFMRMAAAERIGRRANQPAGQHLVAIYERSAVSSIANSIRKAREVIGLIEAW